MKGNHDLLDKWSCYEELLNAIVINLGKEKYLWPRIWLHPLVISCVYLINYSGTSPFSSAFFFNHLSKLKMCIPLPLRGELYFPDAYRGCSLPQGLGFRNTLCFWKLGIAIRTLCSYTFEHDCFPLHLMRTLRSFLWSWLSKMVWLSGKKN